MEEYKEYSSPLYLDQHWGGPVLSGPCKGCGTLDENVPRQFVEGVRCKWCLELMAINLHLKSNGVRRLPERSRLEVWPYVAIASLVMTYLIFLIYFGP